MTIAPKTRLFEEHTIPTEGNDTLHAMAMLPRDARRVVFMPPLVGAGAAQAPMTFRKMTRRGCILLSFQYRGHPRSTGRFDLDKTIADVRYALRWAWQYAQRRELPLHGLTQCYGTIPLLAQFATGGCGGLLRSISLGSALVRMDQILRIADFVPVLARHLGSALDVAGLKRAVVRHELNWNCAPCREALFEYLSAMFPELHVTRDSFEELGYDWVNLEQTLWQFLEARYLDGVSVPTRIPVHLFLGERDGMLGLETAAGRQSYEENMRKMIPHAVPHYYDIDHFGRGPGREPLIEVMADICEQSEAFLPKPPEDRLKPHFGARARERIAAVLD